MTKTVVHNEVSQAERREVAKNDRRARVSGATYSAFAISEADVVGGRYAAQTKASVTGAGPVRYPEQPATSPWASDPVGPEAPLGFSVDETPIVGEAFEVEKSLRKAHDPSDQNALPGGEVRSVPGGNPTGRPRRRSRKRS